MPETRNFSGNAVVIFQPAEEGGAGASAMIDDGLMERFGVEEVYGMHNMPALAVGDFAIRKGPLMAAADEFTIDIEGKGGHAAMPHRCVDPVIVGAQIVTALQTIVSRNVDPLDSCVVSVTRFEAGSANNVIPQSALAERDGAHAPGGNARVCGEAHARNRRRRREPPPARRPRSTIAAAIRRPSTIQRKRSSRSRSPARSRGKPRSIRTFRR